MRTRGTIAVAVNKGALLLDARRPGWADEVNLGRLGVGSCRDCVLGQVYGEFNLGCAVLDLEADPATGRDDPADHGFHSRDFREAHALKDQWTGRILERKGRGPQGVAS